MEHEQNCPNCGKLWNESTDYFVLGLQPENYFLNERAVKDNSKHWLHINISG